MNPNNELIQMSFRTTRYPRSPGILTCFKKTPIIEWTLIGTAASGDIFDDRFTGWMDMWGTPIQPVIVLSIGRNPWAITISGKDETIVRIDLNTSASFVDKPAFPAVSCYARGPGDGRLVFTVDQFTHEWAKGGFDLSWDWTGGHDFSWDCPSVVSLKEAMFNDKN